MEEKTLLPYIRTKKIFKVITTTMESNVSLDKFHGGGD